MSPLTCFIGRVFKSVFVGMKCVLEHLGLSQHCLEALEGSGVFYVVAAANYLYS